MPRPRSGSGSGSGRPGAGAANRTASSGSFHAGAPIPTLAGLRRLSSTTPHHHRYQTFPPPSPKTPLQQSRPSRGPGPSDASSDSSRPSSSSASSASSADSADSGAETPLPVRQLLLLAFLSLSEQTALNSISPYLPEMVTSMPGIPADKGGLYVGILASAFALAQLSTNFLWGYASDVVGRKPVLLAGTSSLMCCFCIFGLCRKYWQILLVHVAMGLLNGNAACVPTVLGEVTDRSNQSRAFAYLPVIYSLGSITGPALGGILVGRMGREYPYLGPNVLGAAMLALSVIVVSAWFEETLDESGAGPWQPAWISRLSSWIRGPGRPPLNRNTWSSRWPRGQQRPLLSSESSSSSDDDGVDNSNGIDGPGSPSASKPAPDGERPVWKDLLNTTTLVLLATYLMFQLSNISFNSLYPIFAAAPPPTGRGLGPGKIGVSLSAAGLATIIFQAFLYRPLKARVGSLGAYRLALFGIAVSMVLMPWVGYLDDRPLFGIGSGRLWLYVELGVVLIFKNICAVGGLSSVMLLITNSAPSHASLGTLNGAAQTLSALGRSIGPFVSGGLFTLSINVRPKGEALAWSVFGGLALVGWVGSLFICGTGLESEDWEESDSHEEQRRQQDDAV
ncbi:putative membrane protein [Tolypocladium ophioglossoides CBS 100239]|uniref:Putative membrane protein n=1 Tax=Tolypocladium ophioglossoides (strain CBS 100239) TaxID=1163406 RepID=A0A0L0N5D3_TOLOC|nr:putative membrane protein [Tolypocladium ophioglossoides CBS 100239]